MTAARSERWRCLAKGVSLAALLSLSVACATTHESYRTGSGNDKPPLDSCKKPEDSCTKPEDGCTKGVSLATIEFDDQGVPWTPPRSIRPLPEDQAQISCFCRGLSKWPGPSDPPSQLECVEKEIEELAATPSLKAVTVIIFVHGWKNDASDRSKNLSEFRKFLVTQKSSLLVEGVNEDEGAVLGIYIGWRGQIFPGREVDGSGAHRWTTGLREVVNFIPRQLSIFNRGEAASRTWRPGWRSAWRSYRPRPSPGWSKPTCSPQRL